ncbi:MAG: acetyl/propionyl/methylcrotonyl-CoA carboxylase subunit alpha [Geminicoccaceae bacterium]
MFDKILIANRGEIACRVIRSCNKLGIRTVAVYSDADADALHVRMADEKVHLGPPPAAQSYLLIDRIVEACKATGAQAVHPGYGFLSERAAFARALDAAGIAFIGPPVGAIEAMGDKIESKRLAREAGVSTVPGTLDAISDPEEARRIAGEIGYPVMIKASAGGGGKGMRIAMSEDELVEGLERAQSEARNSFGDDRCFIEKFVTEPRHIEIQVLGDRHGNCIYLGERECSIQRRHQKVIEEAPSPFLDETTRKAMGEQAVALAKAVDYCSAGTVEFIVDSDRNFYFLEMNTRLQVEHPVTELVTGVDLVEQMIRIAAGEELTIRQSDVKLEGWAMEARVYAEEPAKGFLPSTGRLVTYREPKGDGIRVDTGIYEGSEVSMFYDPMIAKLCAFGTTREEATARLRNAIDGYAIDGPGHNLLFLNALLSHPRFIEGRLTTGFIAEEYGERFDNPELAGEALLRVVAIGTTMRARILNRAKHISGRLTDHPAPPDTWFSALIGETAFDVEVTETNGVTGVRIDDHSPITMHLDWKPGQPLASASIDGHTFHAHVRRLPEGFEIAHAGSKATLTVRRHRAQEMAMRMPPKQQPDTSKMVISPMPGLIVRVAVEPGQEIKAGQELLVLEAMKMENVLRAERDGIVETVEIAAGDTVSSDQLLISLA